MNKLLIQPKGVVFDVGNVLIDWNPDYLYRRIFANPDERHWFLTHVCSMSWHGEQDRGRPCADGIAALVPRFPEYRNAIEAYYGRWLETIQGPIEGSVEVLESLKAEGIPVFGLSNFPWELWDLTVEAYPFLGMFDDRVLSSEVGVSKPQRRIYDVMIERTGLKPEELVFVDDREENLATAQALGIRCVLFENDALLKDDLAEMGLPVVPATWPAPVEADGFSASSRAPS